MKRTITPHLGSCKKVTSIRGQRLPIYQVDSTLILFFFLQACKSNHFFLQSPHSSTSTTATTMAQKPKLTLFVDIVSPFGYYAFHTLQVITRTHHQNWRRRRRKLTERLIEPQKSPIFNQVEITYIPIFLGGVMKACDNRPPINIKSDKRPLPPQSLSQSPSLHSFSLPSPCQSIRN